MRTKQVFSCWFSCLNSSFPLDCDLYLVAILQHCWMQTINQSIKKIPLTACLFGMHLVCACKNSLPKRQSIHFIELNFVYIHTFHTKPLKIRKLKNQTENLICKPKFCVYFVAECRTYDIFQNIWYVSMSSLVIVVYRPIRFAEVPRERESWQLIIM